VVVWVGLWAVASGAAEPPPGVARAPESVEALRQIETRVQAAVEAAGPATVALNLGRFGSGSGVVVDARGTILTAAHVIGEPGRLIQVRFPDGSVANARTLGMDRATDAGMARLEGDGPWPFVPLAEAAPVSPGDWVVALGHPAGFDEERPVTARLGRAIRVRPSLGIQSDCSVVGGDSGGPLLNLDGRVVGIHSRIGPNSRTNIHVHARRYVEDWDRLEAGDRWGRPKLPLIGVVLRNLRPDAADAGDGVRVVRVLEDSAADRAGLKRGDIIQALDGRVCGDETEVYETLAMQLPGDPMRLTVRRGDETLSIDVELGERE
jgi:serine protease Do